MSKYLSLVVLFLAHNVLILEAKTVPFAESSAVEFEKCGGSGFYGVKIEGCDGAICIIEPAKPVHAEVELIPAESGPALRMNITAEYLGFPIQVIDTILENSSVQAGVLYIITLSLIPNDSLTGLIPIRTEISHNDTQIVEACFIVKVYI